MQYLSKLAKKKIAQKMKYINSEDPLEILEEVRMHYSMNVDKANHEIMKAKTSIRGEGYFGYKKARRLKTQSRSVLKAINEIPEHEILKFITETREEEKNKRQGVTRAL